jgi:hypothetical protein
MNFASMNLASMGHWGCGDDRPCIFVRTLVSGLANEDRKRWRFLVLQPALDDSGKDGLSPAFTIAGYVATVDEMMALADEWKRLLNEHPKLDYIKGYEAFGLNRQFAGWTQKDRDSRLLKFVTAIMHCSGKGLAFVTDHPAFDLIENLKDADGVYFKDPYELMYLWSFSQLLQMLPDFGEKQADLVFDRDLATRRQANRAYKRIFAEWPTEITSRLLRKEPHWEDDKQFLALQAADLLAYCVRAGRDPDLRHDRVRKSPVYAALRAIPTVLLDIDDGRAQYLRDVLTKGIQHKRVWRAKRW